MTLDEARNLRGDDVLWKTDGEHLEVRIVAVTGSRVLVEGTGLHRTVKTARRRFVEPSELSPVLYQAFLAATQAELNVFAFDVLVDTQWDFSQTDAALNALCNLNWAAGLAFDNRQPPAGMTAEELARDAVLAARRLWDARDREVARARALAQAGSYDLRPEITGPALVYLVVNPSLRAVKVGVSDADGSRIAQHRRRGWRLVAAFQVSTGKAAASIERDILQWWRAKLRLPACVRRQDMPQGGWTETADTSRVDVAATVARICQLALLPAARARP